VPERLWAPSVGGRERYVLPNHMAIVHQNNHETDFFYRQIFVDQTSFRQGISLRDGDCVFDIGANIGLFTMFVQQVWSDITVYAFEPIPAIFQTLSANIALYGKKTKLFQCAIGEESKDVELTYYWHSTTQSGRYADRQDDREVLRTMIENQEKGSGSDWMQLVDYLVEERIKGEAVVCALRTLSEVIRECKVERIDLLKIDVEKSELDVLAGIAESDWEKIRQIVIEADGRRGKLEKLAAVLERHDYAVVAEEDQYIKGSGLFNVYARRKGSGDVKIHSAPNRLHPIPVFAHKMLTVNELREHLQQKLPEYSVPSILVFLDSLPLSPNGKLDRQALPAPQETRPEMESPFVAAETPLEQSLAWIWAEILGARQIGVRDNFFQLGGHSLLAIQVMSRLRDVFAVELPLRVLYETPTVEGIASMILQAANDPVRVEKTARALLSLAQLSDAEVESLLNEKTALIESRTENKP
jgi:FkbM family methyltransferase